MRRQPGCCNCGQSRCRNRSAAAARIVAPRARLAARICARSVFLSMTMILVAGSRSGRRSRISADAAQKSREEKGAPAACAVCGFCPGTIGSKGVHLASDQASRSKRTCTTPMAQTHPITQISARGHDAAREHRSRRPFLTCCDLFTSPANLSVAFVIGVEATAEACAQPSSNCRVACRLSSIFSCMRRRRSPMSSS